jgi:hypothetical protein
MIRRIRQWKETEDLGKQLKMLGNEEGRHEKIG